MLQLIRKPDRDWNESMILQVSSVWNRYNSLENPIGIETSEERGRYWRLFSGYNSLENPIGIETFILPRDVSRGSSYNSLENPIGIETGEAVRMSADLIGVTTH